jgi:O-antigen/teichoic acid export membrane protein
MIAGTATLDYASNPRRTLRSRLDAILRGTGIWAMGDQGVVSLGNFLTIIVLFRAFGKALADFGAYAVLIEVVLFLNTVAASLITYPLCVKGSIAEEEDLRRLTGSSLILTLLLNIPLAIVALTGSICVGRVWLAPWLIAALVIWQLQETLRRAMTAHLRFAAAIPGDAISYLGQVVYMAAVVWVFHQKMTLNIAFASIAITSLLGGLLQWFQLKPILPGRGELVEVGREFWQTGYWAMLGNLTTVLTVPSFAWVLGMFKGLAAVAIYQSFANLLKIANPVMNTVVNLIIPAGSRGRRDGGVGQAWQSASMYAWQGAAMLAPYFLVLMVMPHFVVRMCYGEHAAALKYSNIFRVFVVGYAVIYLSQITNSFLLSLGASRSAFVAQIGNVIACVIIGLPMTALWGMPGAVWGNLVSTLARVVFGMILIRRIARLEQQPHSNRHDNQVLPILN